MSVPVGKTCNLTKKKKKGREAKGKVPNRSVTEEGKTATKSELARRKGVEPNRKEHKRVRDDPLGANVLVSTW